jgi:hypothetical protein
LDIQVRFLLAGKTRAGQIVRSRTAAHRDTAAVRAVEFRVRGKDCMTDLSATGSQIVDIIGFQTR